MCAENLDRLRNDMASLRVQFFTTLHAEVSAEGQRLTERLTAIEVKAAKDVERLKQQMEEQTRRVVEEMAADRKFLIERLTKLEQSHSDETQGICSLLSSQSQMTSAALDVQRDQVASAFARITAKEEVLAFQLDDTKVKVNEIEMALAKLPGEFVRLLEAKDKERGKRSS